MQLYLITKLQKHENKAVILVLYQNYCFILEKEFYHGLYERRKTSLLDMKAEAQEECQKLFNSYQNIHDKKAIN